MANRTIPFHIVQKARELSEKHGMNAKQIASQLQSEGWQVTEAGVDNWIHYFNRIHR